MTKSIDNLVGPTDANVIEKEDNFPEIVPILPVRNIVLFPSSVAPLTVGRSASIRAIEEVGQSGVPYVGVLAQRDGSVVQPKPSDLFKTGTLALAIKVLRVKDKNMVVFVQGLRRFRTREFIQEEPFLKARVELLRDMPPAQPEATVTAMRRSIEGLVEKISELSPGLMPDLEIIVHNLEDLSALADFVASTIPSISHSAKQELLESIEVWERLQKIHAELSREVEILEVKDKIQSDVQDELGKTQRELFLREQLKAIRKELGEQEDIAGDLEDLRKRIFEAGLPEEVHKEALNELKRLSKIPPASPEHTVSRTYLDWLASLPWKQPESRPIDLRRAREALDRDHYGLEKIKDRILEFLAVLKLRPQGKAPILCFAGPPGAGKTSLGRSIADALERRFVRLSLGGIRDEAEIRGHRRTYIGSLPGQIMRGIRRAGQRNPVFMLDEVDKIGADFRGDPASALLEVLDPEQNYAFQDHYLDVPFNLSQVLFITTANILETIPHALLDRMEVVRLSGYTEEEKLQIAVRYLIPRQTEQNGLVSNHHLDLSEKAIRHIIRSYTREAGLRNLEREIGKLCRKRARLLVEGRTKRMMIEGATLEEFLGAPRFATEEELEERTAVPGVAVGLAWTPAGGEVLFVESSRMPGQKELTMTGQLGTVMQESVKAALSWVRAHTKELELEADFFERSAIHIHVPSGAIPKDGPSAGTTMVTSLVSLLTRTPVRSKVAMTGEITLTGRVMSVGGIKEKILAAHRIGVREVVLPKGNERNVRDDLSAQVLQDLRFHFVSQVEEVIEIVLGSDLLFRQADSDLLHSVHH